MIAITVLRVFVGWHFLYEGIAKLTSPSWSAAGYMKASRGPFAAFFQWIASQPHLLDNANLITMCGLTIVGVLLILGLFTRLAASAGIGFILLFYLCNPPFVGYFYSIPTEGSYLIVNKNLVELCALAVILAHGQRPLRRARPHRAPPLRPAAAARRGVKCGRLLDRQRRLQRRVGAGTNQDLEVPRLHAPHHLLIDQPQCFGPDRQCDQC